MISLHARPSSEIDGIPRPHTVDLTSYPSLNRVHIKSHNPILYDYDYVTILARAYNHSTALSFAVDPST